MTVNLLTEHHLEFLSLKGGCIGSSESTLVKIPHCWKSRVMVQLYVVVKFTLDNVNAPVVATTSWWLHFSAQVVA